MDTFNIDAKELFPATRRSKDGTFKKETKELATRLFIGLDQETKEDLLLMLLQSFKSVTAGYEQASQVTTIMELADKFYPSSQPTIEQKRRKNAIKAHFARINEKEKNINPGLFMQVYKIQALKFTNMNKVIDPLFPKLAFQAAQFMPYHSSENEKYMGQRLRWAFIVFDHCISQKLFEDLPVFTPKLVKMASNELKEYVTAPFRGKTRADLKIPETFDDFQKSIDPENRPFQSRFNFIDYDSKEASAGGLDFAIMGAQAIRFTRYFQSEDFRIANGIGPKDAQVAAIQFIASVMDKFGYKRTLDKWDMTRTYNPTTNKRDDWNADILAYFKMLSALQFIIGSVKMIYKVGKVVAKSVKVKNATAVEVRFST